MEKITDRIAELRKWWLREYYEDIIAFSHRDKYSPNIVCLGNDEWVSLVKESQSGYYSAAFNGDCFPPKVFGMNIRRVTEKSHLSVGRVREEGEDK